MVKQLEQPNISKRSFGQAVIHECEKYWLSMPDDQRLALVQGNLAPFQKGIFAARTKKEHEEWRRSLPYVHPFKWKPYLIWQSENEQFQIGDVSVHVPPEISDPDYPKYLKKLDEMRRQHQLIDSSLAQHHRSKEYDESPTNDQG